MLENIEIQQEDRNFWIEFFGYNFTSSGLTKKLYIKPSFVKRGAYDKETILDGDRLNLLMKSLDAKELKTFCSNRYSLYDISFRWGNRNESIGFGFKDFMDSVYLAPEQVFEPFKGFGIVRITEIVKKIENSMFFKRPTFNPVPMISTVIDKGTMVCIKAYIRYDREEVVSSSERFYTLERVVRALLIEALNTERLLLFFQELEKIGFVFSFVGTDCYKNRDERLKFYFQFYGRKDNKKVCNEIILLLAENKFYRNMQNIFEEQENVIWGLAVSIDAFAVIDGVQLYFYP